MADTLEPIASVTIDHFRGNPGMENVTFEYFGKLPEGTHSLYGAPQDSAMIVSREEYLALSMLQSAVEEAIRNGLMSIDVESAVERVQQTQKENGNG